MAKQNTAAERRHGLRVRLPKQGGPIFLNDDLEAADAPPRQIRVPVEYAIRQPFILVINATAVVRPAGPKANPFIKVHTFIHADELVLRMDDKDHHYKIVGQPDKYDAAGKPSDAAGDPTSEVRWFYDADLVEG